MNKTFYALCVSGFVFFNGVCEDRCKNISPIGKHFISEIRELQLEKETQEVTPPYPDWKTQGCYSVVYSSKDYVSFRIFEWRYTGGAHGGSQTVVGTFRKGKRLKLADLYCLPGEKKQFENLWKAAIVRHFKVKNFEERLKEAGKTFKPFMTENFYFDGKGIHFIYDPYEIDCFAAGTIDIFVPWKMPR